MFVFDSWATRFTHQPSPWWPQIRRELATFSYDATQPKVHPFVPAGFDFHYDFISTLFAKNGLNHFKCSIDLSSPYFRRSLFEGSEVCKAEIRALVDVRYDNLAIENAGVQLIKGYLSRMAQGFENDISLIKIQPMRDGDAGKIMFEIAVKEGTYLNAELQRYESEMKRYARSHGGENLR